MRPAGTPLGELRTSGIARPARPFDAPWGDVRACLHVAGGHVAARAARRAARRARAATCCRPGRCSSRDGAPCVDGDVEGFSAGPRQFDSDITAGRYPRAALGLAPPRAAARRRLRRPRRRRGRAHAGRAGRGARRARRRARRSTSTAAARPRWSARGRLRNVPREEHGVELAGGRPVTTADRVHAAGNALRVQQEGARPQRPHVLPPRRLRARRPRAGPRAARPRLGRDGRRRARSPRPRRRASASTPASTSTPVDFAARRRADAPVLRGPPRRAGPASSPPSTTTSTSATSPPGRARCEDAGAADADVLHLHHLTPLHEAAARVAPDVPVVGHLHGTELLMLERDRRRRRPRLAPRRGLGAQRMRRWARALRAPAAALARASSSAPSALLGLDRRSAASSAPTASTPSASPPRPVDRAAHWRHAPRRRARAAGGRGQDEGSRRATARGEVAAARRRAGRCSPSAASPRSSALGLLVRAFARARAALRDGRRPSLVLLGGYPGEWEGEHPYDAIRRDRRAATSSSPAGTSTTRCPTFLARRRRHRPRLRARAVRLGARRGHGLRPAGRSPSTASARRDIVDAGRTGLARRARRRGARWPARSSQALDRPGGAPAARRAARRDGTRASRGRRSPSAWPAVRRGRAAPRTTAARRRR